MGISLEKFLPCFLDRKCQTWGISILFTGVGGDTEV